MYEFRTCQKYNQEETLTLIPYRFRVYESSKDSMKLFLWMNEWSVDSFLDISVLKIFFYKPDFPLRSYLVFLYDLIPDLRT